MKKHLDYPLTILIMVDSTKTYAELCPAEISAQTVCVAVSLEDGQPAITMEACG
jgi:hypothetical protein